MQAQYYVCAALLQYNSNTTYRHISYGYVGKAHLKMTASLQSELTKAWSFDIE